MRTTRILICAALALAIVPVGASQRTARQDDLQGVTRAVHTYRVAPTADEVVSEVLVRAGDTVEAGTPLVRLRSDEPRLSVRLLELRASSTLRVDAAKAAWDVSVLEERESRAAMADDAIREPEMRRLELRSERDRLAFELAMQEQRETELQLERARAVLDRYTIRAPASGVVTAVNVRAGELPEPGVPLVEIVDTSSLRIELGVPADVAAGLTIGDDARLTLGHSGSPTVLDGRVTFVSPLIEIGAGARDRGGLRTVHVEARNTSSAPAGGLASVRFPD
ncbi:MAG: efflux RND transporter periplasmic adaptor subunit [Planctomycetota bacterium]